MILSNEISPSKETVIVQKLRTDHLGAIINFLTNNDLDGQAQLLKGHLQKLKDVIPEVKEQNLKFIRLLIRDIES